MNEYIVAITFLHDEPITADIIEPENSSQPHTKEPLMPHNHSRMIRYRIQGTDAPASRPEKPEPSVQSR
ncbi:hypothetical protein [Spirillospora sp. NBC_01491]|uniref:hypothetical protein n=1 Tax=Spirillospora sp. NBC_01491 TaxID=2976007 RepID=UPI002E313280|nr:hypothetical protein [Spirillospora sp. NBC_01491]